MNKRTLSLGFAIATTIMLIVPIELSDNAKASTCSFSSSAAHGSLSFHASFTAPGSCSIGAATSQTLFTAIGTGGFKSSCASNVASQTHARGETEGQDSGVHCASFP